MKQIKLVVFFRINNTNFQKLYQYMYKNKNNFFFIYFFIYLLINYI